MTMATTNMKPATINARFRPATKAKGSLETAPKLGSAPSDAMVATTMAVATALLVMLAEFLVRDVNADIIPYLGLSTALKIELLFGEPNNPVPAL